MLAEIIDACQLMHALHKMSQGTANALTNLIHNFIELIGKKV